jgi:hypothetical protein
MLFFRYLKPLRNADGEIVCTFPASRSGILADDASYVRGVLRCDLTR